jgi:lysophospholipase L1-like esterase
VTVTAKFRGAAVKVLLEDQFLWNTATNVNQGYYDVIIDDLEPVKITPVKGTTVYDVPVDLDCGDHTVTLMKRTEASIGNFTFLGFEVGELLPPDPEPDRRILVIGDSITCGSGTDAQDGSPECTSDGATGYWGQPYHSAYRAWGSILGRALGAERHTMCVSGIGLVRNYSDQWDARTMPEVYDLMFVESNQASTTPNWDPTLFVPHAILIALGTNDFSPGEGGATNPREPLAVADFVTTYIAFIDRLKGYYPDATIFLVSSPLLGDGWPTATDLFRTNQLDAHDQIVTHYASDTVQAIEVTKIWPANGCGGHPDAAQQLAMTTGQIEPAVRAAMGW